MSLMEVDNPHIYMNVMAVKNATEGSLTAEE
jgi:hypothetical protein